MRTNLKGMLQSGIRDEKKNIEDRFKKADVLLGGGDKSVDTGISVAPVIENPSIISSFEKKSNSFYQKVHKYTFSMPEADFERIGELQQRYIDCGKAISQSEVIRAAVYFLQKASDSDLLISYDSIEKKKRGRVKFT